MFYKIKKAIGFLAPIWMPEVYFRTGGIDTRRAFIPSQYLQLAK
jgi:hypothetical protein